jgi:hypothetical protein
VVGKSEAKGKDGSAKDGKADVKVDWKPGLSGLSMPFLSKSKAGAKASSQPNIAEFKAPAKKKPG